MPSLGGGAPVPPEYAPGLRSFIRGPVAGHVADCCFCCCGTCSSTTIHCVASISISTKYTHNSSSGTCDVVHLEMCRIAKFAVRSRSCRSQRIECSNVEVRKKQIPRASRFSWNNANFSCANVCDLHCYRHFTSAEGQRVMQRSCFVCACLSVCLSRAMCLIITEQEPATDMCRK